MRLTKLYLDTLKAMWCPKCQGDESRHRLVSNRRGEPEIQCMEER